MKCKNYRDLVAWKKAIELALAIYEETASFPPEERFGLTSQLRRGAVSVPSNIAEGQGRYSDAEFHHYLAIAHGSIREIETQVTLAELLKYLNQRGVDRLKGMSAEVGRLLNGLLKSTKQ